MNRKGASLIEALITMFMITAVIFASLSLFKDPIATQNQVDIQMNYLIARQNILNILRSPPAWNQTMLHSTNAAIFNCFLNQNSTTDANRDCPLGSFNMNLYDVKGNPIYLSQDATTGFAPDGTICATPYVAPPAPPNPQCYVRLNLTASPICAASPCENPQLEVVGNFEIHNTTEHPFNVNLLNFRLKMNGSFCPVQTNPTLVSQGAAVSVVGNQVAATVGGKVAIAGSGHFDQLLLPCRKIQFNFSYALGLNDFDVDGVQDPESFAGVCLMHPTLGCLYELRIDPKLSSYDLLYNGAVVATKPPHFNFTSGSVLGFKIYNGRVQACFDSVCFYTFEAKLGAPFDVRFRPASTSYSAGFSSVNQPLITPL